MVAALDAIPQSSRHVRDADDAIRIVHDLVPAWASQPPSASTATVVPGGITNRIFRVTSNTSPQPLSALVRIFGAVGVISPAARATENEIFAQLARCAVAPRLLAVFANGRIEQWLSARCVTLDEMRDPHIVRGVASAMAALHSFCPHGDGRVGDVTTWSTIDAWLALARALGLSRDEFAVDELAGEVEFLRRVLVDESPPSPVVFCHNDLLAGNIMIGLDGARTVSMIDFEYSAANYRGFDVGNYFAECMGGTVDGTVDSSKYPTRDIQLLFCRTYLKRVAELAESAVGPTDKQVADLVSEANQFSLLAHLYWSAWAVAQSGSSTVDFPYLLFARQKLGEYLRTKECFIVRRR
jgi:thiamine kinase-like enzyme